LTYANPKYDQQNLLCPKCALKLEVGDTLDPERQQIVALGESGNLEVEAEVEVEVDTAILLVHLDWYDTTVLRL